MRPQTVDRASLFLLVVAALLLWIGCALAILSIGIFFVPAAIVMTVAAVMRDRVPSHAV